jgi:hypothetical protein
MHIRQEAAATQLHPTHMQPGPVTLTEFLQSPYLWVEKPWDGLLGLHTLTTSAVIYPVYSRLAREEYISKLYDHDLEWSVAQDSYICKSSDSLSYTSLRRNKRRQRRHPTTREEPLILPGKIVRPDDPVNQDYVALPVSLNMYS